MNPANKNKKRVWDDSAEARFWLLALVLASIGHPIVIV